MIARLIRYLWRVAVLQQVAEIVVGELFRHVVVGAFSESAKFKLKGVCFTFSGTKAVRWVNEFMNNAGNNENFNVHL